FFGKVDIKGENEFSLINNAAFDHLVKVDYKYKTYRIKHPLFSLEILKQISNPNEHNSEIKGILFSNLLPYILNFIEDSRYLGNGTSKSMESLIRELFITREEVDMIKAKFAPLIEKIRKESIE